MPLASRFPVAFLVLSVAACRGPRPPELCDEDCADSSSSEVDPGIQTVTGKPTTDSTSDETSSETATTGDTTTGDTTTGEAAVLPEITDMSVTPELLLGADWVTVEVHADNADRVAITVGKDVTLELERLSETEFVGEFTVSGASWNGTHVVEAIAWLDSIASEPEFREFVVDAPAAGTEIWLSKDVPAMWSMGTAIDTTPEGEIIEAFSTIDVDGARCHLRRRHSNGKPVWSGGSRELAVDGDCIGEAVKFGFDGTIWALANVENKGVNRWYLWHTDGEGTVLEPPTIGSGTDVAGGLDVDQAGGVLLCGSRPATMFDRDLWVKYVPQQGNGWTVAWDYIPPHDWLSNLFSENAEDCAFIADRIVVVGEAHGVHEENNQTKYARGVLLEYSLAATLLQHHVDDAKTNTVYNMVTADPISKYAVIGSTCGGKPWPCAQQGFMRRFNAQLEAPGWYPIKDMASGNAITHSPHGYLVTAGKVSYKPNFMIQGWLDPYSDKPLFMYHSPGTDTLHTISGVSVDALGYIYGVGTFKSQLDEFTAAVVKIHPH